MSLPRLESSGKRAGGRNSACWECLLAAAGSGFFQIPISHIHGVSGGEGLPTAQDTSPHLPSSFSPRAAGLWGWQQQDCSSPEVSGHSPASLHCSCPQCQDRAEPRELLGEGRAWAAEQRQHDRLFISDRKISILQKTLLKNSIFIQLNGAASSFTAADKAGRCNVKYLKQLSP